MAIKNLKSLDKKLNDMYQNQAPTPMYAPEPYVDKSELLLNQMSFIASYNKQLLNLK